MEPNASSESQKRKTTLLLTRWLGGKRKQPSFSKPSPKVEKDGIWSRETTSLDYGTPPPIEEPNCYTMRLSEDSYDPLYTSFVDREIIKNLLTEHMKHVGGKLQLLDDLEQTLTTHNQPKFLDTLKPLELNALVLYASYLGREDLIRTLHERGADLTHSEPEQGLTCLHLTAYSNSLSSVMYLLSNGVGPTPTKKSFYSPFHYAAFGNSLEVARYFLEERYPQDTLQGDESVLHSATKSNALDVIKLLLASDNSYLNKLDSSGNAPIHYATDQGNLKSVELLVRAGCNVDVKTVKGDTALHLAAEAGSVDTLDFLLDQNAQSHGKNVRGETPLHLAARSHSLESCELLLKKARCDPNVEDNDGRTPLHLALGRSLLAYDVTEFLVNWKANINKVDKYGYTPLHVAALNELSQCVDVLIDHGADLSAKTKGGTTALSIILRKTPTSLSMFEKRLDRSITLHQHGSAAGEVELRLDFRPLLQHCAPGEISYLGTFVKEGYKEILEHPLCQSFLHLKWQKIKKYYIGRLSFYLIYVLVLTGWVITALAHNCYNESHGQWDVEDDRLRVPLCANATGFNGFLYRNPLILEIEWYVLVILTCSETLRKIFGILTWSSFKQFLAQAENLVEWCVIVSVFATSFLYTGRTYAWQSHVGAFAVLCGWSNLMLMIGQLPMFGAYVAMFTSVQAQVFKLLLAYACLLVGFTASFCVIFPRSKSFSSPHTGLIKVLVMMTGELDFEELFFPNSDLELENAGGGGGTSWILLQVSAQLSFVLFLLFVTIVLMNLLVGIAVHDIKGLQKTAGLAKLVRQTKLICDVESALFLGVLPKRVMRLLKWTALVLPSPLKAALTVRPLNPRENRLPRELLAASHKRAKDRQTRFGKGNLGFRCSGKNDHGESMIRGLRGDGDRVKNEITRLTSICEINQQLIRDLFVIITMDRRGAVGAGLAEQQV